MSDDHDHDHAPGGHEVDKMPSTRLFNLLFGLSGLTLAACIGVVQLFNQQVSSIQGTRDTKVSFQLSDYREEMKAIKASWSVSLIADDDGVPASEGGKGPHEAERYYMPVAEARKRVLEQSDKWFKAAPAYRGWRNPDPKAPKAAPRKRPRVRPPGPRQKLPGKILPKKKPAPPGAGGAAPTQPAGKPAGPTPAAGRQPTKPAGGKPDGKAPTKPAGKPDGKAPTKPGQ